MEYSKLQKHWITWKASEKIVSFFLYIYYLLGVRVVHKGRYVSYRPTSRDFGPPIRRYRYLPNYQPICGHISHNHTVTFSDITILNPARYPYIYSAAFLSSLMICPCIGCSEFFQHNFTFHQMSNVSISTSTFCVCVILKILLCKITSISIWFAHLPAEGMLLPPLEYCGRILVVKRGSYVAHLIELRTSGWTIYACDLAWCCR